VAASDIIDNTNGLEQYFLPLVMKIGRAHV